jgi:hypothetical protein
MGDDQLESIQKSLEAATGLGVFRYTNDLEKERWVEWEGDDPKEFADLARKLGDGAIYLCVERVEKDDEREGWKHHRGEIAWLEAAFTRAGAWHLKTWTANWLGDMPGPDDDDEVESTEAGQVIHRIGGLEMTPETRKFLDRFKKEASGLVDSLLLDAEKLHPPPDPTGWGLRDTVLKFYRRKLGDPGGYFSHSWIEADEGAREVWQEVSSKVEKALLAKEQARVLELVPTCVTWARDQGLTQLLQSDVEVFDAEKGHPLSGWGRKELWRRAKLALKAKR